MSNKAPTPNSVFFATQVVNHTVSKLFSPLENLLFFMIPKKPKVWSASNFQVVAGSLDATPSHQGMGCTYSLCHHRHSEPAPKGRNASSRHRGEKPIPRILRRLHRRSLIILDYLNSKGGFWGRLFYFQQVFQFSIHHSAQSFTSFKPCLREGRSVGCHGILHFGSGLSPLEWFVWQKAEVKHRCNATIECDTNR